MKGIVRIGSIDVGMLANGASPIIYKHIFHKDFIRELSTIQSEGHEVDGIGMFTEMGFVMAMQHERPLEELRKLNEDNYIEWLEQFDPQDLILAAGDVANLYNGQSVTLSTPKKEDG